MTGGRSAFAELSELVPTAALRLATHRCVDDLLARSTTHARTCANPPSPTAARI